MFRYVELFTHAKSGPTVDPRNFANTVEHITVSCMLDTIQNNCLR